MMYSEIIKKDSKGFVVKSTNERILLFGRLIKIIKYKEYFEQVLIFYKLNNKVHQRYVSKDYFKEKAGSNSKMLKFISDYRNILLFRYQKEVSKRYFRRYFN